MYSKSLKNILSKNLLLPFKNGQRFIFTFHDISEASSVQYSKNYSTTPAAFRKQISFLSGLFEWVSLDSITREEPFKNNVATILFDDGFKSVETIALPILKKHRIPFSVFVNQCAIKYNRLWVTDLQVNKQRFNADFKTKVNLGSLQSDNSFKLFENDSVFNNKLHHLSLEKYLPEQIYLNEKDIINLSRQDVLIGNHGSFHVNLAACDEKTIRSEIEENKIFLETLLKKEVNHYAIAFGKKEHYTEKIISTIRSAGHAFIYNTNPVSFSCPDDGTILPRISLTGHSPREIMFYINRQFLKKINL